MPALLAILIALAAIFLVWRFVASRFRAKAPADPIDSEQVDDPLAPVPSPRKGPPKALSAAAAVEEPEGESPADLYPPRTL